jgi:hypothetical protein
MNKTKKLLYDFQLRFKESTEYFPQAAYPETAQGAELRQMAYFIRVSPNTFETEESLRQRILERLARPKPTIKEKSKIL